MMLQLSQAINTDGSIKIEKFKLYSRYRLKSGEIGRAVDILGDGEACIFEFEKRKLEDSVDTVFWKDVEEQLR